MTFRMPSSAPCAWNHLGRSVRIVSLCLTASCSTAALAQTYTTAYGAGAAASDSSDCGDSVFGAWALNRANCSATGIPTYNVAMGYDALYWNAASGLTAVGAQALTYNTTGNLNTAVGYEALNGNHVSYANTAVGYGALQVNDKDGLGEGNNNTAVGLYSLSLNVDGMQNTAVGAYALRDNVSGYNNTAVGLDTLESQQSGYSNTALGSSALGVANGGNSNTALGANALRNATTGSNNTAVGSEALSNGTGIAAPTNTGSNNTAVGASALLSNTSGGMNVGIGYDAGINLTTGSFNIDISHSGLAGDSGITRIGTAGNQTAAYIAGIYNVSVSGCAVYVSPFGQLGCTSASSARFKTDIASMPDMSAKLGQLRPVTFKYKNDPKRSVQYGLIAEEVAKVYPDLVIHGAGGEIDGVRYEELAPMLLSEVQRQQQQIATLSEQVAELSALKSRLRDVEAALSARDQPVTASLR
jgi:hypothetical protein